MRRQTSLTVLVQAVTASEYSRGQLAILLRSYTTGFVIDEVTFLKLRSTNEWDSLLQQIADSGHHQPADADDLIAMLSGDRGRRTGLDMIVTGLVRASPTPSN